MAQALPGGEFVGVDLAGEPVARGRALAAELGLRNVRLLRADVQALPDDLGTFDYVVAHGVYSWIPPRARDALLAACRRHLAPHGVAYVSYNAYPGSYLRDMARDVLRFHTRHVHEPVERMGHARALMDLIARGGRHGASGRVLAEHMEGLLDHPPWVVFHDELADVNTPVYFHELAAHAARHGLQFLAEAHLADSQLHDLPEDVAAALRRLPGDVVVREQYLDFIVNRMFRQTLLCHAAAPVRRTLRAGDLAGLWVAAALRTDAGEAALAGDALVRFDLPAGGGVETADPDFKRVLARLGRAWPRAIRFRDLAGDTPQRIGEALLDAHAQRLVDLHVHPPAPAIRAGERPVAAPLARLQAGAGHPVVTNLRHRSVRLDDEVGRALLQRLDGTRDRAALAAELRALAGGDAAALEDELERALARLAQLSLLAA